MTLSPNEIRIVLEIIMIVFAVLVGRITSSTPKFEFIKMAVIYSMFAILLLVAATFNSMI